VHACAFCVYIIEMCEERKHKIHIMNHIPYHRIQKTITSPYYNPVSLLYCAKSAILVKTNPCFLQNLFNSGRRAICTGSSSDTISHNTPTGLEPARRDKSTAASVCPSRVNTPLSRARRGKMCPGRTKSSGFVPGFARRFMVRALSFALIPVVIPIFSLGM